MPINLVIDIGNHSAKFYVFADGKIIRIHSGEGNMLHDLKLFLGNENFSASILASVIETDPALINFLQSSGTFVNFSSRTPTPLKMGYSSPETLGPDRIAAAIGGWQLLDEGNVLTIVAGTCITYNIVTTDANFVGGAISPGLHMRLKAMHEFTDKLPLVEMKGDYPLTGYSTETSIRSGALNGAIEEVRGMIASYEKAYPGLKTVLSGGDGAFLAEALKNGIFARPDLVAEGLNTILKYNVADNVAD